MRCIKPSGIVVTAVFVSCFIAMLASCGDTHRNQSHPEVSYAGIERGKALAAQYCQSCHALPDPSLLDAKSWERGVLPQMGPRLGIFFYNNTRYPSSRYDRNLDKNFYPQQPVMNLEEWGNIMDYYIATSPDTLAANTNDQSIADHLPNFSVSVPSFAYSGPATAFTKILEDRKQPGFLFCDAMKHLLFSCDAKMKIIDSVPVKGAIVDMEFKSAEWLATDIGILNPNNGKYGSAAKLAFNQHQKLMRDSLPVFDSLQRPVQITSADLNNDGRTDYIVCEFGFQTGALTWMEAAANGTFKRHVLRPFPGAVKAYVQDYNNDGLPDVWVLFAQGEEGVFLFTNKGHGRFDQKEVIRFQPAYGSSYFEFADFNKDGYPDIVYTCGDNADYSPTLKPYHGVYIFLNDGRNNFTQQYFFHINGCYKAIARDFDNDGDLDLATISFFADYANRPQEGFVYLENTGNFNFKAYSSPETQKGRWLTMDAGDVDGDGYPDLILGNFSIGPAMMKNANDWKKGPPFIILKNLGKKHS